MYSAINHTDHLNQRVRTILQIDGENKQLYIKLRWHKITNKWFMSIDDANENTIIRNIPLIAGESLPTANLLRQFAHLGVGSAFVIPRVDHPSSENPTSETLGADKEYMLVWGDTIAE